MCTSRCFRTTRPRRPTFGTTHCSSDTCHRIGRCLLLSCKSRRCYTWYAWHAAWCMLHVVCCMLYVVCCMLSVVCCMLYVACGMLSAAWGMLSAAWCMLHAACCLLHGVCCLRHGVCCMRSLSAGTYRFVSSCPAATRLSKCVRGLFCRAAAAACALNSVKLLSSPRNAHLNFGPGVKQLATVVAHCKAQRTHSPD
jgi:hypothetical protein